METLRKVWEAWKYVGKIIGDFIGRVVLTVFYFTIFLPFGLGVRWLSDPLQLENRASSSYWLSRRTTDLDLEDARRQC
jgi:hypothetical protein